MTKTIIATAAALLASSIVAQAADLPSRKAPVVAPVVYAPIFTWTGFYVGADAGYGFGRDKITATDYTDIGATTLHPRGFVARAHAGYNYQIQNFVVGVEGDVGYAGLTKKKSFVDGVLKDEATWDASARLRAGYAMNRTLFYVTGGAAFTENKLTASYLDGSADAFKSGTRVGYAVGAGVEYAFTNNLLARVEYRYTDFGSEKMDVPAAAGVLKSKYDYSTVTGGVSYKF